MKDEQIKKLKPKIGDLVLDNDVLRERPWKPYPLEDTLRMRADLTGVSKRRIC